MRTWLSFGILFITGSAFATKLPLGEIKDMLTSGQLTPSCKVERAEVLGSSLQFELTWGGATKQLRLNGDKKALGWFVGRGLDSKGEFWRMAYQSPKGSAIGDISSWGFIVRDESLAAEQFKVTAVNEQGTLDSFDCSL